MSAAAREIVFYDAQAGEREKREENIAKEGQKGKRFRWSAGCRGAL